MTWGRAHMARRFVGGFVPLAIVACGFTGLGTGAEATASDAGNDTATTSTDARDEGTTVEIEGSVDAPVDVAPEAFVCPTAICNGGCAGGTCRIDNPANDITCPAGMPCRIVCTGDQVCTRNMRCGSATSCQLECTGVQACDSAALDCGDSPVCGLTCGNPSGCNSLEITPKASTALCVACVSGSACNSVSCLAAPSSMKCTSTCSVSGCGTAATVTTCP